MMAQPTILEASRDPRNAFQKIQDIMTQEDPEPLKHQDPSMVKVYLDKYEQLFTELQSPVEARASNVGWWGLWRSDSPAKPSIPTLANFMSFIEEAMQVCRAENCIDPEQEADFQALKLNVRGLAMTLSLFCQLQILDLELSQSPFDNVIQQEAKFLYILEYYNKDSCQSLLVKLDKNISHPLSRNSWECLIKEVSADISALKSISAQLALFNEKMANIKVEADLPTDDELTQIDDLIEQSFPVTTSKRYPSVKLKLTELVAKVVTFKDSVLQQAKVEFAKFDETFSKWQKILKSIQDGGISYPWRYLPPSLKEVTALKTEIAERKHYYQDWPCVAEVMSKKEYELNNYSQLLSIMKKETLERINAGFADLQTPTTELQHMIRIYKELLIKGGYDKAEDKVAEIELQLFRFAHQKYRQSQWCSWFRRSYFDNFKANISPTWRDIAMHLKGGNYGYSGARTKAVMQELGWLKQGRWTELAPKELIHSETQHQISLGLL